MWLAHTIIGALLLLHVIAVPTYDLPHIDFVWQRQNANEKENLVITPTMRSVVSKLAALSTVSSFAHLFRKLSAGDSVVIMVLGGSFTAGNGCSQFADSGCKWSSRFVEWLQLAYPRCKVELIDGAVPSTSSFYGLHFVQEATRDIDLLLVDYSLNDHGIALDTKRRAPLQYVTEQIIRNAYHRNMSVIYIATVLTDTSVEETYLPVLQAYDVPLISYREVVKVDIARYTSRLSGTKYPPQWQAAIDYPHPRWETHVMLAQTIAFYFVQLAQRLISETPALRNLSALRPVLFASNRNHHHSLCYPTLVSMTSLNQSSGTTLFIPYQAARGHTMYYPGWRYEADLPGKPAGWISYSSRNLSHSSRLAFHVVLVEGFVSVTYLETYQNAGIFEIWLSSLDFANDMGAAESHDDDVIGCCNKSKVALYPTNRNGHNSNSVFIDTFRNTSKVSEIVTKTIKFAYHGTYLVNIRHHSTTSQEFLERNGDKVKLLGVYSC